MLMTIMARADAQKRGLIKYFTGKPCKRGHVAERRTSNGLCSLCERSLSAGYMRTARLDPIKREKLNAAVRKTVSKILSDPERTAVFKGKKAAWNRANQSLPETKLKNRKLARARYQADPAAGIAKVHKRRALKLRNGGTYTSDDIDRLFRTQSGKCVYCRCSLADGYHVDHIVALKNGGSNDRRNLQLLCPLCNRRKGAHDPIIFVRQELGLLL